MNYYFTYTHKLLEALEGFVQSESVDKCKKAMLHFPELVSLFEVENSRQAVFSIEHDHVQNAGVLWTHLHCVLERKLTGLELRDLSHFQTDNALSTDRFDLLCRWFDESCVRSMYTPALRAALVFSDIAKGGSAERRSEWENELGVELQIHNTASAAMIEKLGILNRYAEFRHSESMQKLVVFLVRHHGLIGQYIRGEITLDVFVEVAFELRETAVKICEEFGNCDLGSTIHDVSRLYLLLNILDTAGVREGLMTDSLFDAFADFSETLENEAQTGAGAFQIQELCDLDEIRQSLFDRLIRLRNGAIQHGESPEGVMHLLEEMAEDDLRWLYRSFRRCQLWYFEPATGILSAASQLCLLMMGLYWGAQYHEQREVHHLDFVDIANSVSPARDLERQNAEGRSSYRIRILDAILSRQSMHQIIDGTADIYKDQYIIAMNKVRAGTNSISMSVCESEESEALITLLSIYERKSTVAFHSALKMLCDIYGLRKDDFDRLSNETQYLVSMNAAKSDKERMLSWLKSGRIVEVGPGGGVVLDLLEKNFPDAEITGVDASHQVVVSLESKRKQSGAKWRIIEGNAFKFDEFFEPESLDGIVFCSILHEIYSYIEWDDGSRFHLESVRDMLKSAFDALAPGGRILIRDGIMPPHSRRRIEFKTDDAISFFEAFCREFKGRKVQYQTVGDRVVELDSADAMEFLYTYTWGPESFPYEVREQYGVMTYDDYCHSIRSWLGDRAHLLEIPSKEATYLQPGYVNALQDKVNLTDENGRVVEFPASNAIIVIEKI